MKKCKRLVVKSVQSVLCRSKLVKSVQKSSLQIAPYVREIIGVVIGLIQDFYSNIIMMLVKGVQKSSLQIAADIYVQEIICIIWFYSRLLL